ncbi:MAG: hypothetical protein LBF38_08845 [Deltaproteobacteria bacterium]|jgi:hypothetical protein|nr:hypothetical protein [Deltaproteobacteria bacterium]
MSKGENDFTRPVEVIKEELADLNTIISSINWNVVFSPASQLLVESMKIREKDLKEELKVAEWLETPYEMELTLSGARVVNQAVPITLLSNFLDKLQKLRLAAAQMASDPAHGDGRSPEKLEELSTLRAVGSFNPSSFAIELTYLRKWHKEPSLFPRPNDETERPGESLFLTLLSGYADPKDIKTMISSPKLYNHYQDFLNFLIENDLTIESRTKEHPFAIKMTSLDALKRKNFIDENIESSQKTEKIEIDGLLVSVKISDTICFTIESGTENSSWQISKKDYEFLKSITLGGKIYAKLSLTNFTDSSIEPS